MTATVSLQHCPTYDEPALADALRRVLGPLGGLGAFVSRGDRVLVKPNMISNVAREKCAQTDPAVVGAVLSDLLDLGGKPFVGDSPAWGSVRSNARANGLDEVCGRLDVPLVPFNRPVRVANRTGEVFGHFKLDRAVLEADRIINVPKLKAHRQVSLSCAVKNMFGAMPGRRKAWWHLKAGSYENYFGRMLVEVYALTAPAVSIVDGITAMEGIGPIKGTPRQLDLLMASADGPAIDRVCCEILGLRPSRLATLRAAIELGVGTPNMRDIAIVGDPIDRFRIDDFQWPKLMMLGFSFPRFVRGSIRQAWLASKK